MYSISRKQKCFFFLSYYTKCEVQNEIRGSPSNVFPFLRACKIDLLDALD